MDRRKVLLLFGAAWISAALLTWFLWARTRMPREEKKVLIAAAARDMPMGTLLKKSDLRFVAVAEKAMPRGAVLAEQEAVSRVLLYPVSAGEPLTGLKLSRSGGVEGVAATIEAGFRAVSVPVNDTTGVAGLVQPNARVDVLFTRPGPMAEAVTATILENVRVLSMGRNLQAGQPQVDSKGQPRPVTVATLIVTPEQAQKLELAKNQGKISLSLRNPLDSAKGVTPGPVTAEALDPAAGERIARARRARSVRVDDPKVWQELTGKKPTAKREPEPPRVVVDVYRGDKHVQELFR